MRHEARFNYMEIQNSKSGGNIYSNFEENFGATLGVHFRHTIYRSKAHEFKIPMLQTVCKSELKLRSYGHLKTTAQT